jgi:hypothetical protein
MWNITKNGEVDFILIYLRAFSSIKINGLITNIKLHIHALIDDNPGRAKGGNFQLHNGTNEVFKKNYSREKLRERAIVKFSTSEIN